MKKILFAFAALAALVIPSCTLEQEDYGNDTITARIDASATRTSLEAAEGGYNVNWVAGDRITVVADGSASAIYETSAGGSTVADFKKVSSGSFSGKEYVGYYPSEIAEGSLPAHQEYLPEGQVRLPMVSDPVKEVDEMTFRPVTGILKINVSSKAKDVKVKEIKIKADQGMSGPFSLVDGVAVAAGSGSVILGSGEGVSLGTEPVPFLVSVPACSYTGLEISVITTDGKASTVKLQDNTFYTVRRAEIRQIYISADSFDADTTGGEAILVYGPDFNEYVKQLSVPGRYSVDNDSTITRIVFKTNDHTVGQKLVSDIHSPQPVYASFDKATKTVTVTTPASEIYTAEQASHMFRGFCLLTEIENLAALNTSRSENLSYFFHYCYNLKSVDISHFDTSKCKSFGYMFCWCSALTSLDVSRFDTSKAMSLAFMFQHCEKLEAVDVSGFDVSNVESMDNTFGDCYSLKALDLSKWNTDNVTDTRSMFNRCKSIKELDIRQMSFPKTTRMTYMFFQMESLEILRFDSMDFSRWPAGSGTAFFHMFRLMPCLKELYLGEKGVNPAGIVPTPLFTNNSDAGSRTSSVSGSLTIHCHKDAVNWLAKGNLRWIHSGYKNQKPIDVKFLDYKTSEEYTPTWAAD